MNNVHGESSYRRFLDGDKKALEELVKLYGDPLTRFAYCYVKNSAAAEDIMEDTFVALLLKRKRLSRGENLRAYLYKITRNKCIDYLRFHRRQTALEDYENVLLSPDFERDILVRERKMELYRCMQSLPQQYAEILYLVYIEDTPVEEACEILRKSKKQVYNLLARAKAALKKRLVEEEAFYENL